MPIREESGYWIAVDQADRLGIFRAFSRRTLEHLGTFTGAFYALWSRAQRSLWSPTKGYTGEDPQADEEWVHDLVERT